MGQEISIRVYCKLMIKSILENTECVTLHNLEFIMVLLTKHVCHNRSRSYTVLLNLCMWSRHMYCTVNVCEVSFHMKFNRGATQALMHLKHNDSFKAIM